MRDDDRLWAHARHRSRCQGEEPADLRAKLMRIGNDPVIFLEYAIDVAQACRERGIKTVAVSAGYICEEPRAEFFRHMDAANIDLKGFTEHFYKSLCSAQLGPVLETLAYLKQETRCRTGRTLPYPPGEMLLAEAIPYFVAREKVMLGSLSQEERKALNVILAKLVCMRT